MIKNCGPCASKREQHDHRLISSLEFKPIKDALEREGIHVEKAFEWQTPPSSLIETLVKADDELLTGMRMHTDECRGWVRAFITFGGQNKVMRFKGNGKDFGIKVDHGDLLVFDKFSDGFLTGVQHGTKCADDSMV